MDSSPLYIVIAVVIVVLAIIWSFFKRRPNQTKAMQRSEEFKALSGELNQLLAAKNTKKGDLKAAVKALDEVMSENPELEQRYRDLYARYGLTYKRASE